MRNPVFPAFFPVLFTLALSAALYLFNPFPLSLFELKFRDLRLLLPAGTPSEKVLFVSIGEKSVNAYGRWPWDRALLARGLARLEPAELVVLDMVFSETTGPGDRTLAATIADLDNVVCGFFLRPSATQSVDPAVEALLEESALERVRLKHPRLAEGAFMEANILPVQKACMAAASFTTQADEDGLYRRYPLASVYRGRAYPILGVQALRYGLNQDLELSDDRGLAARLGDRAVPVDDTAAAFLRYYPAASYKSVPFVDVAEGRVPPETFAGKIVVVGVSEAGVTDIRPTPAGPLPGPLLHYTFLSNYLNGELPKPSPAGSWAGLLFLGLLPLGLLALMKRERIITRAAAYAGVYLLFFAATLRLYQTGGWMVDAFYPLLALGLSAAAAETAVFRSQEAESRFIKEAFRSYLSPELLDQISQQPERLKLGGEEREITILFSDVRGFTSLSEKVTALELVEILTRLFTPMTRVIIHHEGMLDKYIGDAIMALFNAPMDVEEHPAKACRAALAMVKELETVNADLAKRKLPPVDIGVGVNTGVAVAGNMGSAMRFNYSAIGDPVNLASRLEGQTKNYGCRIVVSQTTRERLDDGEFALRCLGETTVKGKALPVRIYEVMEPTAENREMAALFEEGLSLEEVGDGEEAKIRYEAGRNRFHDPVAAKALARLNTARI